MPINLSSVTPGIPSGTTAQRPAAPAVGDLYYNTDEAFLQVYDKGAWYFYGIAAKDVTAISAVNQGTGRAYNDGQMQVSYTPDTTGGVAKTTTIWSDPQQLSIVATGSPVTFTGLTSGVSHRFYALMTNNAIASNQGGELLSTGVIATTVPQAPQSLVATGADSSVSIAFTGATGGSAITNYSYSTDGTNYTAFSPAQTSSPVTITGLTNGQSYTIYLKATNANGTSLSSSGVSVTANIPITSSYDSIATYTLSSNGTITFTSIPQTYKHLQLRVFGKTTRPTFRNDNIALRFNGDTGNNYSSHEIIGDNGTGREANTTSPYSMIYYGGNIGTTVMSSVHMGVAIIDIFDYTNTNLNTTTRSISGWDESGGGGIVGYKSGQWMNTAAVTEIFLRGGEGTQLGADSTVALYGIKG